MGLEELLNTLKVNERKQIDTIWDEAKAEAETIHQQVAEAIASINEEHEIQLASACQRSVRSISSEAQIKARKKKLLAYQELEKVLYVTACELLTGLREYNYETVFATLVNELPKNQWESVLVNPGDVELAARFYTPDVIKTDPNISGGLKVFTVKSKVVIDNTFEKRLERRWPHILPAIIKKIEVQYDETKSSKNI